MKPRITANDAIAISSNKQPPNSVDKLFNGLQLHRQLRARAAMSEFLDVEPWFVQTDIYRPEEKKMLVEAHMHHCGRGLLLAANNANVMAARNQRMTSIIDMTVRIPESELDVVLEKLDLANRNLMSALMTLRTAAAQQDEVHEAMIEMCKRQT